MTATSCIMALIVEVILIKLGCYLLGIGNEIHFLDFMAYCGYKYCILIVSLAASAFGKTIKYCVFCYCILSYGFFLVSELELEIKDLYYFLISLIISHNLVDPIVEARLCTRKCECPNSESTTQAYQFPTWTSRIRATCFISPFEIKPLFIKVSKYKNYIIIIISIQFSIVVEGALFFPLRTLVPS